MLGQSPVSSHTNGTVGQNGSPTAEAPNVAAAELLAAGQVFPLVAVTGQFLIVGRRSELGTFQPDVDLSSLPGARTVSRRHALISYRAGGWYLRVDAATTNRTLLDDNLVADGAEVPLSNGSRIQLGRVSLVFQLSVPQDEPTDERLELKILPIDATVEAGSLQQVNVTLINHTGLVRRFHLSVEGLPPEWYKIQAEGTIGPTAVVDLFNTPPYTAAPDAVARLKIVFTPPRRADSRAGVYGFRIVAVTEGTPGYRKTHVGSLTIEPFRSLSLEVDPERIHGARGSYVVDVENLGNQLADVVLTPDGDGLVYEWNGLTTQSSVQIAPGATSQLTLDTRVQHRHWFGSDVGYNFSVRATIREPVTAATTDVLFPTEKQVLLQLICGPRVPGWLQSFLHTLLSLLSPIVMLLGILAIAYIVVRPPDVKQFAAKPASAYKGDTVSLSWDVDDRADRVTIEGAGQEIKAFARPGTQTLAYIPPRVIGAGPITTTVGLGPITTSSGLVVGTGRFLGVFATPPFTTTVTSDQPTGPASYTLTAYNDLGVPSVRTIGVEVTDRPVPRIVNFSSSAKQVAKEGLPVDLLYATDGAKAIRIGLLQDVSNTIPITSTLSGDVTVTPRTNHSIYTLVACAQADCRPEVASTTVPTVSVVTKTLTIDITPPSIDSFTAQPSQTDPRGTVQLQWSARDFSELLLDTRPIDGSGDFDPSQPLDSSQSISFQAPYTDTTYLLTAFNAGGSTQRALQVKVTPKSIVYFKAEPSTITKGGSAVLSWQVDGSSAVSIAPGTGVPPRGTLVVQPMTTTTYVLNAGYTGHPFVPFDQKAVVTVLPPSPKIDLFLASPSQVISGTLTTLTYRTEDVESVGLEGANLKPILDGKNAPIVLPPPDADGQAQGTITVSPTITSTYILVAKNKTGQVVQPLVVAVPR